MSIEIDTSEVTPYQIKTIEEKLRLQKELDTNVLNNAKKFYSPRREKVDFFYLTEDRTKLRVPFFWGKSFFGKRYLLEYPAIEITFHGELRQEQKELKEESTVALSENNCCLISCYPGFGKTILSLYLLSLLQRKTLIIINKLVILEQWVDAIRTYLHIDPCIIRGKKSKLKQSPIYIANAINIPKHTEVEELSIGCVIVDECHLIMTSVYSKVLFLFRPQYLIGLSATPVRYDNFNNLFDIYWGPCRLNRSLYRDHTVYHIHSKETIIAKQDKFNQTNWNSVIEHQSLSEKRRNLIASYCEKFKDRYILILCKRIQQMILLEERMKEFPFVKDNTVQVQVLKESDTIVYPSTQILISSFQKCGVGFSCNRMNMLIFACDCDSYILQYLGRVFRTKEVIPIIIDIVDDNSLLKKHWRNRKKCYLECGGTIIEEKPLL